MLHEQLARGDALLERIANTHALVVGAGALGANIVETLARTGWKLVTVIDFDRVEDRNLSTQPYSREVVGALKAVALANHCHRATGMTVVPVAKKLDQRNAKTLLRDADVVFDVLDNSVGRRAVFENVEVPCLHVGLANLYAEGTWNERYVVPSDANDDVCDYPMARTLVMVAASLAVECMTRFIAGEGQHDFSLTFGDMKVAGFQPPPRRRAERG